MTTPAVKSITPYPSNRVNRFTHDRDRAVRIARQTEEDLKNTQRQLNARNAQFEALRAQFEALCAQFEVLKQQHHMLNNWVKDLEADNGGGLRMVDTSDDVVPSGKLITSHGAPLPPASLKRKAPINGEE